ncbi:MAG: iron-containing alcohol dehydrogenase, partial [Oscillospiraceae bacterium]|nr:iron-containing alcohol dehydrogenase [Oscillospiraceae bacterium]
MSPIHFSLPTQVFLETDAVAHHAALFARGKKAMIVTGRTSAKRNGAQDDVVAALAQHQIPYVLYDAVPSNPGIATCYEGARLAKESGADFVIAIGGGSPMDAGKAIALLAASPLTRDQLFTGPYTAALPLIHIPTTSGTGSEVTPYAILSDDEAQTKR